VQRSSEKPVLNSLHNPENQGPAVQASSENDSCIGGFLEHAQGRQVTEFVPGSLAMDSRPLSLSELCRVGRLVRAIHDAIAAYEPDTGSTWITHIPK
jgi:hypothetical protein